jgi:hypothetical protein
MTPLAELKEYYDEILDLMPDKFDSHQFILKLAEKHQPEYVRALYTSVDVADGRVFGNLHGKIGKSLHQYATYVKDQNSSNIFGNSSSNALWQKK